MKSLFLNLKENDKVNNIIACIALLLTTIYPSLYFYFTNAGRVALIEILLITGLFLFITFLALPVCFFMFRCFAKSALFTCALIFIFLNFAFIRQPLITLHHFRFWEIAGALLLIFIGLFLFLLKKVTKEGAQTTNRIIALIFSCLILVNGVMAAPTIYRKVTFTRSDIEIINVSDDIRAQDMPNIYLFIFDEFSSIRAANRYYDYDNRELHDFFTRNNINYSESSNNRSPYTELIVADILNLREVANVGMTHSELMEYIRNPHIYNLVHSYGYKINTVNFGGFLGEEQSTYRFSDAAYYAIDDDAYYTIDDDVRALILNHTALYPITESLLFTLNNLRSIEEISFDNLTAQRNQRERDIVMAQFRYCGTSYRISDSNLFTIAYFRFPHARFIFNEHGRPTADEDDDDWKNKNMYLGQYIYCTSLIIDTVEAIIKNDPNSIIFLLSDHSARYLLHMQDRYNQPKNWLWAEEVYYLTSSLNAVYYQGNQLNIEGLSGVNTVIRVFNDLFGLTLSYVDQSFFAPCERFADD